MSLSQCTAKPQNRVDFCLRRIEKEVVCARTGTGKEPSTAVEVAGVGMPAFDEVQPFSESVLRVGIATSSVHLEEELYREV